MKEKVIIINNSVKNLSINPTYFTRKCNFEATIKILNRSVET